MEDTLVKGDRVIVSKLTPGPFDLHRGDVVVFEDPDHWLDPVAPAQRSPIGAAIHSALTFVGLLPSDEGNHLIKRVIGLPGDHVTSDGAGRPAQGQRRRGQRALPQARRRARACRPSTSRCRRAGCGSWATTGPTPPTPGSTPSAATASQGSVPERPHRRPGGHRRLAAGRLALAGRAVRDVRQGPRGAVLGEAGRAGAADGSPSTPPRKPSLRVERALQRAGPPTARAGWTRSAAVRSPGRCRSVSSSSTRRAGPRRSGSRTPSCSRAAARRADGARRSGDGRVAYAVGHASPAEIDAIGIMAALRLAGTRALAQLDVVPDLVILDGNHDWLTDPAKVGLLAFADEGADAAGDGRAARHDHDQGRHEVLLGRRRQRAGQGGAGRDDGGARRGGGHVLLGAQQGVLRARAPGRAVRARCRASTTAGRGGCPGWPGSRTASSRRTRSTSCPTMDPAWAARARWSAEGHGAAPTGPDDADRRPGADDGSAVSDSRRWVMMNECGK